tara:strand:+ start:983 stop:1378 length:396 start_codon:yes stop_codon:yes gene_type:complete
MSTYNTEKETIVHTERYKLTPDDEAFRVMMITRTHDPEFAEVPNVGYCTLKDIRGWVLKDIFYENTYFHDAMKDKLEDLEADQSNTILLLENPKTGEQMQYCIQGDPENNHAGYIGQSYWNADGVEERVNG